MENEKQPEIIEQVDEKVNEQVDEEGTQNKQEQELPELVNSLKATYEKMLKEQKKDYEEQIAERDKIITQIISGGNAKGQPNDKMQTIIDKINEKRTYKKW